MEIAAVEDYQEMPRSQRRGDDAFTYSMASFDGFRLKATGVQWKTSLEALVPRKRF